LSKLEVGKGYVGGITVFDRLEVLSREGEFPFVLFR